jgi:hypothetical protein
MTLFEVQYGHDAVAEQLLASFSPPVGRPLQGLNLKLKLLGTLSHDFFLGRFIIAAVGAHQATFGNVVGCVCSALGTLKIDDLFALLRLRRCWHIYFNAIDG